MTESQRDRAYEEWVSHSLWETDVSFESFCNDYAGSIKIWLAENEAFWSTILAEDL